jgi:lipid-A-disaccharide synthase-like uncharacterized protein
MKTWYLIGFAGQICFGSRFLVQWISSEVKKKSMVPLAFWHLSILGGLLLLVYAIWRRDPVFIVGQALGQVVYVRNLILIHRERTADRVA